MYVSPHILTYSSRIILKFVVLLYTQTDILLIPKAHLHVGVVKTLELIKRAKTNQLLLMNFCLS